MSLHPDTQPMPMDPEPNPDGADPAATAMHPIRPGSPQRASDAGDGLDSPALGARVDAIQLRHAYERHRTSALWSLMAIAAFAVGLLPLWPMDRGIAWLLLLLAVLGSRVILGQAYRRASRIPRTPRGLAAWRHRFVAGAVAGGLSWAFGPVVLAPVLGPSSAVLLALIPVCASAVAVSQLSSVWPALVAFVVAALGPTALVLAWSQDPIGLAAGPMVAIAGGLLLLSGRASHRIQNSLVRAELRIGRALVQSRRTAGELAAASADREIELRRLSAILDATGAGTAELDTASGRIRVNERFAQMLGRDIESIESLGAQAFPTLFHEADLIDLTRRYRPLDSGESNELDTELRLRHVDGHWVWVHLRARVLARTDDGAARLVTGVYVDVTERRMAEQRWRSRAELSADWFWETDARFQVRLLSDGVRHALPIPTESLIGRTLAEVAELQPVDAGWGELLALLSGHQPFSGFALAIHPPAGERRVVELDGRPRFDDKGDFVGYEGVGRDVTERRVAIESTKESLALVDTIFEAMPIPVVMKDLQGNYLRSNRAFREMLLAVDTDVTHLREVHDREAADIHQAVDDELLRAPGMRRYEVRQTMNSGRLMHAMVHKATLVGSDGSVRGLVGALVDVTEERSAAAAMKAARDAAEQANRAKSAFLATMSHELRTPLNAVIGAAQLLRTSVGDARERGTLVAAIENSGLALLGLIESVMDLSRIEAAELRLAADPFDLLDCIDSAIDTAAVAARERGLRIAAVVPADLAVHRIGDFQRLRQVLLNLLGNAVKFTAVGEVVLTVDEIEPAGPGDSPVPVADGQALHPRVRFVVQDTGIGIEPEALPLIFESFRQAESGAARRFAGSGLGLAIVRELVQAMGGSVSVTSEPGRGSRFEVLLPLAAAEPPTAKAEAAVRPWLEGATVAIHEPHEPSAAALAARVARLGLRPVRWRDDDEAGSGLAAATRPVGLLLSMASAAAVAIQRRLDAQAPGFPILCISDPGHTTAGPAPLDEAEPLPSPPGFEALRAALAGILPGPAEPPDGGFLALHSGPDAPAAIVPARHESSAPMPVAPVDPGAQARVLLVEDDPTNQVITSAMLAHRPWQVVTADDGATALAMLRAAHFDLVLMDWQMPDLDGLEVTRRIRAGEAGPQSRQVPIVAVTANAFLEDRQACLAAGMDDFVSKPLRLDALITTAERWIQAGRNA